MKRWKGINPLTAFYSTASGEGAVRMPIGYEIIAKTEKYMDEKEREEKRRRLKTKNEMTRDMISGHISDRVKFRYVLADSWFLSCENTRFVNKKKKVFLFEMKENRLIALNEGDRNQGCFERIEQIRIPEHKPMRVWLKDLNIPVSFTSKSNDLTMAGGQIQTFYKKRWGVEEYHKSLKQNASVGSSPARTERTRGNHIFSAIYAYIKLEKIKMENKINHFALKALIYTESLKTAMNILPCVNVS